MKTAIFIYTPKSCLVYWYIHVYNTTQMTCIHICTYVRRCTYVRTYIYTYTYICTCTYTEVDLLFIQCASVTHTSPHTQPPPPTSGHNIVEVSKGIINSVHETRQSKATIPEGNSFFLKRKNELPQAGFKPATFCILGRCYHMHVCIVFTNLVCVEQVELYICTFLRLVLTVILIYVHGY